MFAYCSDPVYPLHVLMVTDLATSGRAKRLCERFGNTNGRNAHFYPVLRDSHVHNYLDG